MKKEIFINLSKEELEIIIRDSSFRAIKEFEKTRAKSLKYFTIDEGCEMLKVSRPTLTKYITTGDISASKIKGMYRIPESEIVKILEGVKSLKYKR